jgi:RNA polymerase sigma factor (TIGR02999 family)
MISQSRANKEPATIAQVYDRLRSLARGYLAMESAGHTLQATALVHAAIVRLGDGSDSTAPSTETLVAKTALSMRRVLVDHARRKHALKRSGGGTRRPLDESLLSYECRATDILALHEALERLEAIDAQAARIVDLRFFGMLTREEAADALGVSRVTADRLWRFARLWLYSELHAEAAHAAR